MISSDLTGLTGSSVEQDVMGKSAGRGRAEVMDAKSISQQL